MSISELASSSFVKTAFFFSSLISHLYWSFSTYLYGVHARNSPIHIHIGIPPYPLASVDQGNPAIQWTYLPTFCVKGPSTPCRTCLSLPGQTSSLSRRRYNERCVFPLSLLLSAQSFLHFPLLFHTLVHECLPRQSHDLGAILGMVQPSARVKTKGQLDSAIQLARCNHLVDYWMLIQD